MPGFSVEDLIHCYETGVFPMAETRDDPRVFLVEPERRGVMPLDGFHVPRRLARTIRGDAYEVRIDSAFAEVLKACAETRPGREETWINPTIERLYQALFVRGMAHSVETWADGVLVGGLYGVSIGAAFFGESMFSAARDASKVALAHLVARLKIGGYALLDAQFQTEHLAQFGAEEIAREAYLTRLKAALPKAADFYRLEPGAGGASVLQAITQRS